MAEGKLKKEIMLTVGLQKLDTHEEIITKVLLDCGATRLFMHQKFTEKMGFTLQKLEFPIICNTWNDMVTKT